MEANLTFFYVTASIISVLAFGTAIWLYRWVASRPSSNKKVAEVGQLIKNGANTFLAKEYKVLTRFTIVVALLIFVFLPSPIWKGDVLANIINIDASNEQIVKLLRPFLPRTLSDVDVLTYFKYLQLT